MAPGMGRELFIAAAGDVDGNGFSDAILFDFRSNNASLIGASFDSPVPAGESVPSGGGDLNGDGFADIAVGSPNEADSGRVRVLLGSSLGIMLGQAVELSSPTPQTGGDFGASVSLAGDINGDGYSDLLVGAPGETSVAVADAGRVYVFPGSPSGLGEPFAIANPEPAARGSFGGFIMSGGDINCDGIGDFVVAAGKDGEPRMHLYLGTSSGAPTLTRTWGPGTLTNEEFGGWGSAASDLDGDGSADVVACINSPAPMASEPGIGIWWGSCTGSISDMPTTIENTAGFGVTSVGDVTGDGIAEVGSREGSAVSIWSWSASGNTFDEAFSMTTPEFATNLMGAR